MSEPIVRLAEQIARFHLPFEFLKTSSGAFDEKRRFLLDRCIAGDPEALQVREDEIAAKRHWHVDLPMANEDQWYSLDRFVNRHAADLERYRAERYPWMLRQRAPVATDPRTDLLLDQHVISRLMPYGFSIEKRKASSMKWECNSDILGSRCNIYFDKGSYRPSTNMTGHITLPSFQYGIGLAEVFFFSAADFWTAEGDELETQLERFFGPFELVFPDLLGALEESVRSAESFLKNVKSGQ